MPLTREPFLRFSDFKIPAPASRSKFPSPSPIPVPIECASLLFCDGANGSTEDAIAPIHELTAATEVKAARAIAIDLVGRRTPIVAIVTIIEERSPVTAARSREKDTVAVGSSNLIALNAVLGSPLPCTFIL